MATTIRVRGVTARVAPFGVRTAAHPGSSGGADSACGTKADSSPGFADADSEWDGLRFSSEYQLARMAAEPHGPGRALGHHRAPFPPKIPLPGSDSRT